MSGRLDRILAVISGSLAAACGGMAGPEPPPAREAECMLTPAPRTTTVEGFRESVAPGRAPIVVALDQPIDAARAPWPTSFAEQVVFAHLYETLVRVDCTGSVIPGLAESWRRTEGGWLFTLRSDARFHDGTPVTARAVADGLVAAAARPLHREVVHRAAAPADIASVTVMSDDVVRVDVADSMRDSVPRGPEFFASPEWAVHKAVSSGWPVGSGPYEAADPTSATGGDEAAVYLEPARGALAAQQPATATAGAALPLAFRVTPGDDPRNAIDVGVDVLVTADPDAIDYARARGSYVTAPLPWDAAYVLLTPVGPDDADARARIPTAALDDLARDAVRGVARASLFDASWTCAASSSAPEARARRRPRVAFARDDPAAAGLAERLVALARTDGAGWIRQALPAAARSSTLAAVPVSADDLAASLRRGSDAAYVIAVDPNAVAPCPQPSGQTALRAVPLVDTRSTAILRSGLEGVTVDAVGTLRFARAWRRDGPEARR